MKLSELKAIAKQNKIVGRSIMNKPEYIATLGKKGLLLEGNTHQTTKLHPAVNHTRYDYLKLIRHNPKRVILEDLSTMFSNDLLVSVIGEGKSDINGAVGSSEI